MGCFSIHVCLKTQLCLRIGFSTSFDVTQYAEAALYTKNLLFSHSIICIFSKKDREGERVKLTKCDPNEWDEKCHYIGDK